MNIRVAQPEDLEQIRKYDCHIPEKQLFACVCNGLVNVMCDGGRIVGVLRWNLFWQTIPFLDLLYIGEAFRGQGLGSRMMADWELSLKESGYQYGMLSTQEDETGKYFYEKLGYRRIGAFLPPEQDADELMYLKEL